MLRVGMFGRAALLLGSLAVASVARADATGSFDGTLSGKKIPAPIAASAVFTVNGKFITGTVALPADLATFGGAAFLVSGKGSPKKLKVTATGAGGIKFSYKAKIVGDTIRGSAKLKKPGAKPLAGTLALTRNVFTADGSACDSVYTANQSLFVTQVLGSALASCTTCHQPGLQASAARLQVVPTDPLATARAVALFVNSADPTHSRVLEKPLNVIPHGGNRQITPGSTQELILLQWVNLVAAAHCN